VFPSRQMTSADDQWEVGLNDGNLCGLWFGTFFRRLPVERDLSVSSSFASERDADTYLPLLLFSTRQVTSSVRQLLQGRPCSSTLHLTLRALQFRQAFPALLVMGHCL
jgi:hypothetical protein